MAHARGDPRLSLDQGHAIRAVDETQQPVSQEEGQHGQQGSGDEVGSEPGGACAPGSKRKFAQASASSHLRRQLSAPDRAPGCPKLRPASATQPLGPRLTGQAGLGFDIRSAQRGGARAIEVEEAQVQQEAQ